MSDEGASYKIRKAALIKLVPRATVTIEGDAVETVASQGRTIYGHTKGGKRYELLTPTQAKRLLREHPGQQRYRVVDRVKLANLIQRSQTGEDREFISLEGMAFHEGRSTTQGSKTRR